MILSRNVEQDKIDMSPTRMTTLAGLVAGGGGGGGGVGEGGQVHLLFFLKTFSS